MDVREEPDAWPVRAALLAERHAVESGDVTIRQVTRRQLFVGEKPVGAPFE